MILGLPPPSLPVDATPGGHGPAFTLLFVFVGVATVAGAIFGNLLADRYLRRHPDNPALTFGRKMLITALAVTACSLAIFAALAGATFAIMQFM